MTDDITPQEPVTTPSEPVATEPTATPDFTIPDDYKDKGWAAKVKSTDDLWKTLDNAQQMIGKKAVVPDFDKAPPEEIDAYLAQLRPADKSAYQFGEGMDDNLKTAYADALYEAGIPAYSANKVAAKMAEVEKAMTEEMMSLEKLAEMAQQKFGSTYKETMQQAVEFFRGVDPKFDEFFDALPNTAALKVVELAKGVRDAYDKKQGGAQIGAQPTPPTVDLRQQASELTDKIIAANKTQPPNFDEINRLKIQLNEINTKRAKNESI